MRPPSLRVTIGIFGLVWGVASEAIYYRTGASALDVLRDLAIGWIYLYGGLAIWSSRPANPTGRLMTLVGLTWFIGNVQSSDVALLHVLGTAFADVVAVALIALILAYPSGRLETQLDRATIAILAVGTTVNNAVRLLPLSPDVDLEPARQFVGVVLASFAGLVVIRRWVVAPRGRRTELLPVLIAGSVLMGVLVSSLAIQSLVVPPDLDAFLLAARGLAPAAIPLALLVGFYRQSELRQRALLDALPDFMIRLTRDGQCLDVRNEGSVLLEGPDHPLVGGRIEEAMPQLLWQSLLVAAAEALDSGATQTLDISLDLPSGRRDLEARVTSSGADEVTAIIRDFTEQRMAQAELRQSRARIIEATDATRRRLERDLHDGAQQRLISASLAMRLARSRLDGGVAPSAAVDLDAAANELKAALVELRELARGIHPAILTEAGLGPAIGTLVERAVVPAEVIATPDRRLPSAVESTGYFVVSEALANVAKYSSASRATVSAECVGDSLCIEVTDDGVGGADPSAGSGLRGLADRVAAIGGSLSIDSPVGSGTRLSVEIPLTG